MSQYSLFTTIMFVNASKGCADRIPRTDQPLLGHHDDVSALCLRLTREALRLLRVEGFRVVAQRRGRHLQHGHRHNLIVCLAFFLRRWFRRPCFIVAQMAVPERFAVRVPSADTGKR